jgi:allantoinase
MTLGPAHLAYPLRRYGMDHERYDWSLLAERRAVRWPGGKPLAVWINVSVQHFPLTPTAKVKLPGGMTMPYPDLRHFTLREHGNRVGVWRLLEALDRHNLSASFAVNAAVVERHLGLVAALRERLRDGPAELVGHSWSMDTPHAGAIEEAEERETIARSLGTLRRAFACEVHGWIGPGRLETANTPDLLREAGLRWFADWVNDDMPYPFRTRAGALWALPLPTEIEDRFVVLDNLHAESSWADQAIDAFDALLAEGRGAHGARLFALSLHPWVMGQAHRVRHLERVLAHVAASRDQIWCAMPSAIVDAVESPR